MTNRSKLWSPAALRRVALACALALGAPLGSAPAFAQNNLPALGDPDSADFGVGTERKIGDEIMREIRRDPAYMDDPLLLEYVQSIWQPLLAQARTLGNITSEIDQRFAWEPFLVRDASVNAFALPGGYVGVHLGLIAITANRDELASVLAHEMSHVTQRHIARSVTSGKRQSLASMAALVLGLLAASRSNSPDAVNAVVAGSQAAAIQGQLNFSRDMEREADRVGFAVMSGAGFAPAGMASMFEKMEQSTRLTDAGGFPYLRTHPLTSQRIGEARSRLGTAPPVRLAGALEHTVAEARARVLMDTRSDALRVRQAQDAITTGTLAERLLAACESAHASSLLRDWARADAGFARALSLARSAPERSPRAERAIVFEMVQSQLSRGEAAKAGETFRPYANERSRPALLLGSQLALAAAPLDDATIKARASDLQTWVATHPNDSLAWTVLGQAWAKVNQPLRALRAEAEARVALGDLVGAIDRLRAGQRVARGGGPVDFIDASVIDARLRDVETQRKQLEADEKALR
ncbi:M48 family metalloprotease [Piscinibacter koreensis]|uniref:M48 family metalloprotease n=1 Tax=Piscinibacter koreensis TaxID=2742824 RepID=UPI0031592257